MHVEAIGVSPLKGGRHRSREHVLLQADGPADDRVFAFIDLDAGQVVKTVEHPSLVTCQAHWDDGTLSLQIDGRWITAAPEPSGHHVAIDYWGRTASLEVVEGPWAREFSRFLGRKVVLARSAAAGEVVYGAAVTIATTSSLRHLTRESGIDVDERRFRPTFTIDTGECAAHVEDAWAGRELELGSARLLVQGGVARCAVIDLDPDTGARGTNLLKTLAGYRLQSGDINFAVYAEVVHPGIVHRGDRATLLPAPIPRT
ncbi:MOSC domain-containing protein [Cryobacterium psychrophilum]|nr:MOSC N-terminal beta barrel domain-containing protein [Cryobacterium psychrophilum]TDW29817.1 uncharacterized protein YcbX [Cryobacterium psychrophilum]